MFMILRKISFWASLIGIAAVILLVRKSTAVEPMPSPPHQPPAKGVARGIGASGMVEALHENTGVGVPVAALVKEVRVAVWDKVEAGAPLLILDDRELQAQLRTQQADLRVREAELAKAQRQHARTDALLPSNGVSRDEAETRRDDLEIARARMESARATAAQTQALIERLTVRAPIAGTVLQVNLRAGEYATPAAATAPLLLGSVSEVQVRAEVDEQIAPRVKPGNRALGYLKGESTNGIPLEFVRIEPYVVPKRNLTGSSAERVDTRVLQVIYKFPNSVTRPIYVGQQLDLFINE
jgi:RND family efflux transporter MFP subunit